MAELLRGVLCGPYMLAAFLLVCTQHTCVNSLCFGRSAVAAVWHTLGLPTTQFFMCVIGVILFPLQSRLKLVNVGTSVILYVPYLAIALLLMHRWLSHQAFRTTSYVGTAALGILASLCNQGPPLWWAACHARHHRYCDRDGDPHSWSRDGFLYAWLGWTHWEWRTEWAYVAPRFRRNTVLLFLHYAHPVIVNVFPAMLFRLNPEYAIWGWILPSTLASVAGSLAFNVKNHPPAAAGGDKCKAIDTHLQISRFSFFGEDRHKLHHERPRQLNRDRDGFIDLSYWMVLRPLLALGVIESASPNKCTD